MTREGESGGNSGGQATREGEAESRGMGSHEGGRGVVREGGARARQPGKMDRLAASWVRELGAGQARPGHQGE